MSYIIQKGEILCFSSLDEFPPTAKTEREYFARVNVKSNITIPLSTNGSIQYVLTVGALRKEKIWHPQHVARLRLIGEILVNALDRKRREEELQRTLEEINQLKEQAEAENIYLRESLTPESNPDEIVGRSPAMQKVLAQIKKVAPTNATILIEGETGVGKEVVARLIHKLSDRKSGVMVIVNCAALPAPLIESELFGRESGAYTGALSKQIGRFELANSSTILLDEIGELSLELQTKLLRVRWKQTVILKPGEVATTPVDQAFLEKVLAIAEKNLGDEKFSIEAFAYQVGMSRSQLHRKLHALTNQSASLFLRSVRLQRAAQMLKQHAGTVAEITYRVGFSSQAYFTRCFREQFGCSPMEYASRVD